MRPKFEKQSLRKPKIFIDQQLHSFKPFQGEIQKGKWISFPFNTLKSKDLVEINFMYIPRSQPFNQFAFDGMLKTYD